VRGAALLAATLTALGATVAGFGVFEGATAAAASHARLTGECERPLPTGASEPAAEAVVERFLRVAVVLDTSGKTDSRRCGVERLGVPGLAPARYPTSAGRQVEGWYQLAPRIRNARGVWEYAGFLYVHSPSTPSAAFEFLLELRGQRWLVSSFRVAPGSAEVDFTKAPT
jgi:hypothetical protein